MRKGILNRERRGRGESAILLGKGLSQAIQKSGDEYVGRGKRSRLEGMDPTAKGSDK